jgi:hypothetical protein
MLSAMLLVWATSAEAAADGADNGDGGRVACRSLGIGRGRKRNERILARDQEIVADCRDFLPTFAIIPPSEAETLRLGA